MLKIRGWSEWQASSFRLWADCPPGPGWLSCLCDLCFPPRLDSALELSALPSLLCRPNSGARLTLLLIWQRVYQWDVIIAAILLYSFQFLSSSNGMAAAKHSIWPRSGESFPRLWILYSVEASGKVVAFSESVCGFTNSKQIFFFFIIHYIKLKHQLNCRLLKLFGWHTQSSGVTSRFHVSVTVKLVCSGLNNWILFKGSNSHPHGSTEEYLKVKQFWTNSQRRNASGFTGMWKLNSRSF